ncbi:MAG TPA: PepSY domain-containing protein [Rhizobiales bacterium]|nr:hypothetical protein BMS3Bbin10_00466 [bacterium BMS3Bbin10]HDO52185.1 PepSY domain-containing protein [Hyphomicrobiales bacterium]
MRKIITIAAASLMMAATIPAYASDDDVSCGQNAGGQQLSVQAITEKAAGMGYDVRKVKREDGCFEVYAIGKNGARVEIYMNPVTGAVLKIKNKS